MQNSTLDKRQLNAVVRKLSELRPWLAVRALIVQWMVISAAAAAAVWSGHPAVYALAIVVIATRQHALAILVHEGAHYRLFRTRWLNNLVSDVLIGFPIGLSTALYRSTHLRHHAHLGTDLDPDARQMAESPEWTWPKTRRQVACLFLRDLLMLNTSIRNAAVHWMPWPALFRRRAVGLGPAPLNARERVVVLAWTAVAAAAVICSGLWLELVLLWLVPLAMVMPLLFRIRALGEHVGADHSHETSASWHVEVGPIERFLFAPLNTNYHLEHHLYPSVPFYSLPQLRSALGRDPGLAAHGQEKAGYVLTGGRREGALRQLIVGRTTL